MEGAATPADRWYQHGDLRLHYLEWPVRGNRPLVLLHGGTQTAHSWDLLALTLQSRFDVYALELRGHGDSGWSTEGHYKLGDYLGDVLAFLEVAGRERVLLLGLSLGARVAASVAALRPQLVERLVLVDIDLTRHENPGRDRIQRFREGPDELEFDQFVRMAQQFNPRRSEDQLRASLRHHLRQLPSGLWSWKYDRRFRTEGKTFTPETRYATATLASKMGAPTLVVRGGESDVTSRQAAQALSNALPRGSFVEVPDAGHTVPGDNPLGFYEAVIGFLDGADESARSDRSALDAD